MLLYTIIIISLAIRHSLGFKLEIYGIDEGFWISGNVTILRNTHIGEESVIGAGAIVSGEFPLHSLITC